LIYNLSKTFPVLFTERKLRPPSIVIETSVLSWCVCFSGGGK